MKSKVFSLLLILLGVIISPISSVAQHNIKKRAVADLALMRDESIVLVPGATFGIGFQIVMSDGETQNTKGFAGGKVKWDNFQVVVKGGTFNDGDITISDVPGELASHKIYISVLALSKNTFSKEFIIDINYVTELQLSYSDANGLSPGMNVPITVSGKLNDGTILSTNSDGFSSSIMRWSTLIVTANGENVNINTGLYTIPSDPRLFYDHKEIKLNVVHVSNLEISSEATLRLDFKGAYVCGMKGEEGVPGYSGQHGSTGSSGRNGYSSGAYGRADGGYGMDGSHGQNGSRGQRGSTGDALEVYVKAEYDSELGTLLKVTVLDKNTHQQNYYLINTSGGSLTINGRGGKGGKGGNGGDGGDGGRGGSSGSVSVVNGVSTGGGNGGNGGNGGYGGNGGEGGDGGDGGTITVYVDPNAREYIDLLKLVNTGGDGGSGGYAGRGGNAGYGGSSYGRGSSGRSGMSGSSGVSGMSGQTGRQGPPPEIIYQNVELGW